MLLVALWEIKIHITKTMSWFSWGQNKGQVWKCIVHCQCTRVPVVPTAVHVELQLEQCKLVSQRVTWEAVRTGHIPIPCWNWPCNAPVPFPGKWKYVYFGHWRTCVIWLCLKLSTLLDDATGRVVDFVMAANFFTNESLPWVLYFDLLYKPNERKESILYCMNGYY